MNWYLARNKKKVGPFSLAKLKELADAGQLTPHDHLLREGTTKWLDAGDVPGLFDDGAPVKRSSQRPEKKAIAAPPGKRFWLGVAAGGGGALLIILLAFLVFGGKKEPRETPPDPLAKNTDKKSDPLQKEKPSTGDPTADPKEKKPPDNQKPEPKKSGLSNDALRVTGSVKIESVERADPLGDKQLRYTINQVRLNLAINNDLDQAIKLGNTLMFIEADDREQLEGILAGFRLPDEPDIAKETERWYYKLAYGVTTIESRYANGRRFTFVGPVRSFDLFSVINNTRWQDDSKADKVPADLVAKGTTSLTANFNRMYWIKDDARRTVRIALPELILPDSTRYRLVATCKNIDTKSWEVAETELIPLRAAALEPLVNQPATSLDKSVLAANWWVDADAKTAFPALSRRADDLSGGRLLHTILQLSSRHKDASCRPRARALVESPATKLDVTVAAASYLAALGEDPDVSALINAARGPNDEQASAVIFALGQLKTPGAVAGLRKLLLDNSMIARHRQIQANLDLIDKSAKSPTEATPKSTSIPKGDAKLVLSPKEAGRADAILFSPDSKKLLLGNTQQGRLDGRVSVWNIAESKKEKDLIAGRLHFATTLALSPNGRTLAMGGIVQMTLNDAATGKNISALGESATVVAFSTDGKTFLSNGGDLDGKIKVWDVDDPKTDPSRPTPATKLRTVLKEHAKEITCLAWAGDGQSFASGSADSAIKIWNPGDYKVKATLDGHKGSVLAIAYAPDSNTLVSGGADKTVKFWDLATQKPIGTGAAHDASVTRIAIHPKGKLAASAGSDQRMIIWDMDTQQKVAAVPTAHRYARSLAFSPDGQWLAVLSDTIDNLCVTPQIEILRSATLLDIAKKESALPRLPKQPANLPDEKVAGNPAPIELASRYHRVKVGFSPDSKSLLVLSIFNGGTVEAGGMQIKLPPMGGGELFDGATGARIKKNVFESRFNDTFFDEIRGYAFAPDGKTLAIAGGHMVGLFDMKSGKLLREFGPRNDSRAPVAFSVDGKEVLTNRIDNKVSRWDALTAKELGATPLPDLDRADLRIFSPDGKKLAAGWKSTKIKWWDLASPEKANDLPGHAQIIISMAFSPDGNTLVSGSYGVKVWDLVGNKERTSLPGESHHVAFAPNGRWIASGGAYGEHFVTLWDAKTFKELAKIQPSQRKGRFVSGIAFSPDSRTLAVWDGDDYLNPEKSSVRITLWPVNKVLQMQ